MLLVAQGNYRSAIGHLREGIRDEVRSPHLYQALAVAYALNRQLRKSERAFQTALSLSPDNWETVRGLAEVLFAQQKYNQVIRLLTRKRWLEDWRAKEILGRLYIAKKEYKEARLRLTEGLRIFDRERCSPNDAHARLLNNVGVCWEISGSADVGEKFFRRVIDIYASAYPQPYQNLARIYVRRKKFTVALNILSNCKERFPDSLETKVLFAGCLILSDRLENAVSELEPIVQAGHANASAYGMLGCALTDMGRLDDAVRVLDEGYARFPEDLPLVNNFAYAHLLRGDVTEARNALISLRTDDGASVPIRVSLTATWGLLSLWEGEFERAKDLYEEAEALAKQHGDKALASTVRQKWYLEWARCLLRRGEVEASFREVRKGLGIKGKPSFHRDLEHLRETIES